MVRFLLAMHTNQEKNQEKIHVEVCCSFTSLVHSLSKDISRWAAQIAHQGQLAHHVGKRQAAVPVTPGNVPGLVPGSEAARQW